MGNYQNNESASSIFITIFAQIEGQLRWIHTTRYSVITQNNSTTVEILVELFPLMLNQAIIREVKGENWIAILSPIGGWILQGKPNSFGN